MIKKVIQGNNLEILRTFPDNYFDSVVTDPPYGISFMGKKWDYDVPGVETWREVLRVLKPGGHILVACGTRTQHRMAINIEDAGFEIRDLVAWLYGEGFPKSHDISKSIDKGLGLERQVVGKHERPAKSIYSQGEKDLPQDVYLTEPTSDLAKQYQGWGTALKPAMELWTLARKPLSEDTVAKNVMEYGTGGINIDGCRVSTFEGDLTPRNNKLGQNGAFNSSGGYVEPNDLGRFPANVIHDGSDDVVNLFPQDNESSTARFFYTAKASQWERNYGLESLAKKQKVFNGQSETSSKNMKGVEAKFTTKPQQNIHPTVKPIELMRYLVKMITPKDGIVLDLYAGSGSTLIACKLEKFQYVGIELQPEYVEIINARLKAWRVQYNIFDFMEEE